jgi:hypothetical protein
MTLIHKICIISSIVDNQEYRRILDFFFYFHIYYVAKSGWIILWMIVASATWQNCKQMDELDLNTIYKLGSTDLYLGSSNILDIFVMFPL